MGDGVNAGEHIPAVLLWNNRPDEAPGNIAEDVACGERNSMKMKAGPLQRLCRRAGPLRSGHRREVHCLCIGDSRQKWSLRRSQTLLQPILGNGAEETGDAVCGRCVSAGVRTGTGGRLKASATTFS